MFQIHLETLPRRADLFEADSRGGYDAKFKKKEKDEKKNVPSGVAGRYRVDFDALVLPCFGVESYFQSLDMFGTGSERQTAIRPQQQGTLTWSACPKFWAPPVGALELSSGKFELACARHQKPPKRSGEFPSLSFLSQRPSAS